MRYTFFILLFLAAAVNLRAQEGFKGEHFIEVTGSAEIEIEPNEITMLIKLREFEENRSKVLLEKIDKDFLAALKDAGIDKKRLTLADAGTKLSKFGRKDKEAFREKSYQLILTSAAELLKLVEKLESIQIDQMAITRLHHTDYEKIRLDLKIKALQAARAKADALIKSINAELGKPLMVREWENDPVYPMAQSNVIMFKDAAMSEGDMAQEPATEFRKLRLRAQVTAQFEIK
jgi:uncharacterized protein YggE